MNTSSETHFIAHYLWGDPEVVDACVDRVNTLVKQHPVLSKTVESVDAFPAPQGMEWLAGGTWAGWLNRYEDCTVNALLGDALLGVTLTKAGAGVVVISVEWYAAIPAFTVSASVLPTPTVDAAEIMVHQVQVLEELVGSSWAQAISRPKRFNSLGPVFLSATLPTPKFCALFEKAFGRIAKHRWMEASLPASPAASPKPRI